MPLIQYIIAPNQVRLGLWLIKESEDFFLKKLLLSDDDKNTLKNYRGKRRIEWLASKYLLNVMTGWAYTIIKDEFGKPQLDTSNYHISMSHSGDYTAAIIAPCYVGIDIQSLTSKIDRVADRVFNANKLEKLDEKTRLEHLHVYWGAKEALFKAYGKKELDFKKNIIVEPFIYKNTEGVTSGVVVKDDFKKSFNIYYKKIENHILVYAIEQNPSDSPNLS
jgi:phosphopantetheinyl transferase (holo-ACP synthase)